MSEKKDSKHFWDKSVETEDYNENNNDISKDAIKEKKQNIKENESSDKISKAGSIISKHSEYQIERVPTGVEGLDNIIEGGIRRHSNVLIEGGAGCGKSIFCMQFIVKGIELFNEPGVYISFEEEKHEMFAAMARFGWDLAKYEEDGKFAYLRYNPEQVGKVLSGGGGLIRDVVDKIGAKRIVIDSISAFTMLFPDPLSQREAVLNLFKTIKKWGCTIFVVGQPEFAEYDSDKHPFNVLEFECDGVIRLYNMRDHNLRTRTVEVFKMRATKHASKTFTMEITDKGVVIYPDSADL
jgi:circadian clock protein KaiC